jgi:hypothetical protein
VTARTGDRKIKQGTDDLNKEESRNIWNAPVKKQSKGSSWKKAYRNMKLPNADFFKGVNSV